MPRAVLERATARAAAAQRKAAGKAAARKGPGPVRNITDPHSRLMHVRGGGFIQGYNTQNVTSEDGLIIATRAHRQPDRHRLVRAHGCAARDAAARITACRPAASSDGASSDGDHDGDHDGEQIGLLLADAGYLSEHNLTIDGPDRLIATGKQPPPPAGRPGPAARRRLHQHRPATTAMAARLATKHGIAAYRHRGHIGERPHGHIKHNIGFRQLSVRGIPRATAEWNLACTVHNLFKAITAGHLTTSALAALTR